MRRRLRSLPLGAWLALGFAVAVAAPALSAGATWWAVSARQQADVDGRLREAAALIEQSGKRLADAGPRRAVLSRLAELHVEADLKRIAMPAAGVGTPGVRKRAPERGGASPPLPRTVAQPRPAAFVTAGVPAEAGRKAMREFTTRYEKLGLRSGPFVGTLFVERPSGAVPLAAASAAGLLAFVLTLIAGVILLRRWVVAPLARLAGDA